MWSRRTAFTRLFSKIGAAVQRFDNQSKELVQPCRNLTTSLKKWCSRVNLQNLGVNLHTRRARAPLHVSTGECAAYNQMKDTPYLRGCPSLFAPIFLFSWPSKRLSMHPKKQVFIFPSFLQPRCSAPLFDTAFQKKWCNSV